jgi:hypothetical protein
MKISRRKFVGGASAILAAPYLIRPAAASIHQSGNMIYFMTPLYLLDTIVPEAGVKSADLASPNGTYPQRVNLSNFRGMRLVPPEAENVKVTCQLFRDYAGSVGQTDATLGIQVESEYPASFATAACTPVGSGSVCYSAGSIVESLGSDVEFPNVMDVDGSNACFNWSIGGNTVLKCAARLQILGFTVPYGYILPSVWPERNTASSSLAMYFGTDFFADSSPAAHSVTAHNVSIQSGSTTQWATPQSPSDAILSTDTGGGAVFDGSTSYLSLDGSGIGPLSGNFAIQVTISATSKAVQGNCQQRILCLGGAGSPAIAIDPSGGGAMLISEDSSALAIGGNSVITGGKTIIEWERVGGVNILRVNGQQDGPQFIDNTAWVLSSDAEIGRHHSGVGYFSGKIHFIGISGVAI